MTKSSCLALVACSVGAVVVVLGACRPTNAADLTRQTDLGRTADLTRQTDLGRTAGLTRQTDLGRSHDAFRNDRSLSRSRPWHPYPMPRAMAYRLPHPLPYRPIYRPR